MQRFERSVDTAAVDVIASQSDRHARKQTPETRGGRLRDVLWIAAAAAMLQASVLQVSVVRGTSMEPTLCDGDRLVVDRIARGIGGLEHGDVVVLRNPVESGIDVPTANTMLVNRADTLGVAQLYQLRGRVGRSNVAARCVLLVGGDM